MIAAFLLSLLSRKNPEKYGIAKESTDEIFEGSGKNSIIRLIPAHAKEFVQVITNSNDQFTITNITFSSSVSGKYYIIKNEHVLATLYTSSNNKNVFYGHNISVNIGDTLTFVLENTDRLAVDFRIGYDIETKE